MNIARLPSGDESFAAMRGSLAALVGRWTARRYARVGRRVKRATAPARPRRPAWGSRRRLPDAAGSPRSGAASAGRASVSLRVSRGAISTLSTWTRPPSSRHDGTRGRPGCPDRSP